MTNVMGGTVPPACGWIYPPTRQAKTPAEAGPSPSTALPAPCVPTGSCRGAYRDDAGVML
jgi:hypothetical protein